jgi:hypothetical protein
MNHDVNGQATLSCAHEDLRFEHRAWFIGALVRSRAALPSLAYSIWKRVPRSHTVIDQCIPAQKSTHHAAISETTCCHTAAYTHGQGTRRAVILPLLRYIA